MASFTHLQIMLLPLNFLEMGEPCDRETLTRLATRQVCFFVHPDIKDSDVREK